MGSPSGWGVYPAQLMGAPTAPQNQSSNMRQLSQVDRMNQPGYNDKRMDKEEDKDMLFADKLYYLKGQSNLASAEKQVKMEMFNYYLENEGTPSADIQSGWNQKLSQIENQKILMKAQEPMLKERFKQYQQMGDNMDKGVVGDSGQRIMVTNDGDAYTAFLGPKKSGQVGWLNQREMLDYNNNQLGIGPGGVPTGINFPSTTGYTGAFNEYFDKALNNKSSIIQPGASGGSYTATSSLGSEEVEYLNTIETKSNKDEIISAANALWNTMPENAKTDLMSKFHENMVRGGEIRSGEDKGKYGIPLDNAKGMYVLTSEESAIITAYSQGKALTASQKRSLGNIQQDYARSMIFSMVPGKITTEMTQDRIKISGNDGSTAPIKGMFTQIGLGELTTNDGANIMVRKNNVLTETPSTFNPKDGSPDLRSWSNPNATTISNFNEDAKKALIDRGGIRPSSFTGDNNFFYSQRGYTNNIAVLENAQAAVVGLTGRVQENYRPETVNGKDGPELSPVDISKMSDKQLLDVKVKTVEVMIAISEDNFSAFRDQMKELYGVEVDNIDKDEFIKKSYYSYESGKKISTDYYILPIWLPMPDDKLSALDDPNKYAKGTYRAQQELMKKERQQTIARIQNSKVNTSY